MQILMRAAAASLALLAAACGAREVEDGPAGAASRTLAGALAADRGFDGLAEVADNAGLSDVFEGVGPYTVFAPSDAAFAAGPDFTAATMRPEGAALVRAHVVPGALTRRDIVAAIARAGGDGVAMRTMADGLITFSREGDGLVATTADGARARLAGREVTTRNGVLQPIDGLLVRPEPAPAR